MIAILTIVQFWPNFLLHKCKQRLTKITQYIIKTRRLRLKVQPELVGIKKKIERREAKREERAVVRADLDNAIKKQLLHRLQKGTDGEIYNFADKPFEELLKDSELQAEADEDKQVDDEANDEVHPLFLSSIALRLCCVMHFVH